MGFLFLTIDTVEVTTIFHLFRLASPPERCYNCNLLFTYYFLTMLFKQKILLP